MALGRQGSLRGSRQSTAKPLLTWSTSLLLAACFAGHVHALPNEPAPVTAIGEAAFFSCNITAYVRAPDLQTGLRAYGEARLVAEGPSCEEITSWDVVLSMRERSVARLPKSDEDLPKAPVYNQTLQDEYYNNRSSAADDPWRNILSFGHDVWDGYRDTSPFDRETREYNNLMNNASMWDVHSAERVVFESSARMWTADSDSAGIPAKTVKKFGIAVPDCIFPPSTHELHVDSRQALEAVVVETQLLYSFRLGLRNSSTIEIPAGKTVFGSQTPPVLEEAGTEASIHAKIQLVREDLRRWEIDAFNQGAASAKASAQADSPPSYELEIEAPAFLLQGRNTSLRVSIKTLNQSDNIMPSKLAISVHTLHSFPWAASFSSSEEEKERVLWLGSDGGPLERHLSLQQHKARTFTEDDFDEERGFSRDFHHFLSYGQPPSAAHNIDGYNDPAHRYELQVNVPDDILPTHQTTFVNFVSFLSFDLYALNITSGKSAEEDEEALWTSHAVRSSKRYARFSGRLELPVYTSNRGSQGTATARPSYLDKECLAPMLLEQPASFGDDITFTPVSLAKQNESAADRLLSRKYVIQCEDRSYRCGSRYEMVGDVWAMKQYREAVREKTKQRERKQLVLQGP